MTGALLGHLYSRGVHRSLDSYQATQWFKSFASPELLVDRAEQAALINRLVSAGHAGDAMMRSAREALVQSIHIGILVAGGAALIGLCLAWFVPPVRISYPESDLTPDGQPAADALPPHRSVL
jgi:phosphoribosylcarboxyaminoimidazole (NCAIR) mutase